MFTSSPFFISRNHTEVFSNYYRPRWKTLVTLVWEILVWSLWKKSRLFYTHNNFRKNYSFNASRIEKIHWNIVKITFSCGNYRILTFCFVLFFFCLLVFLCVCVCCLPHSRTKDHNYGPRTIEHGRLFSNYKQNTWVWNLQLHDCREDHKSYLHGVFQHVTIWFW